MDRKPRPVRHPVLSGTGILLALGAVVVFWRLFLVLAILMAIGGGLFYSGETAKSSPRYRHGAGPAAHADYETWIDSDRARSGIGKTS